MARTWATTGSGAAAGEASIAVDDLAGLGWTVGDHVAVTFSGSNGHTSTIAAFDTEGGRLTLDEPFPHAVDGGFVTYGAVEFKVPVEVMNLQRSILVTGDTDGFFDGKKEGLHMMMFGGTMVVDHTRVEYCGQRDTLGRYCLHWHHVGSCPSCKFSNNAVVEGQTKAITVHGTHHALVDNNVIWNARGVGDSSSGDPSTGRPIAAPPCLIALHRA
jgi:hypothetical protein